MSAPVEIFDVLEAGDVVATCRDIGLIATWAGSMVRLWAAFDEATWQEQHVVTLGGEHTREEAERVGRRMIAEFAEYVSADEVQP